jgi:Tfp pilus assembly protein PilE
MEQGLTFVFVMIGVIAVPMLAVMVVPALARAIRKRLEGATSDSPLAAEVERLHARVRSAESLERRVAELEERLDFAERLLAKPTGRVDGR